MRLFKALLLFPYFTLMDWLHRLHDITYYRRSAAFKKADLALTKSYLLRNPYAICRRYFSSKKCPEKNSDRVQVIYGETFCMTFELFIAKLGIRQHDRFIDLGCGRGRGCFFIHAMTGAEVIGIDLNPTFIKKATAIVERQQLTGISFRLENIFESDLSQATILYFYGVAFSDTATLGIIEMFNQLPAGIRIICVGFSLNDYYDEPLFDELDEFEVFFLWGKTTVWVCETRGNQVNAELSDQIVSEFNYNS